MEHWKIVKYCSIAIAIISTIIAVLLGNIFIFVSGIITATALSWYSKHMAKTDGVILEDEMTARISNTAAMYSYITSVIVLAWVGAAMIILEKYIGEWSSTAGMTLCLTALLLTAIYSIAYFVMIRRITSDEE